MTEEQISPIANLLYRVIDKMLVGFQIISEDYKYIFVNEVVAKQGKRTKEELVGRTMMECYPGIENTPLFVQLHKAVSQRQSITTENEFEYPDGTKGWFQLIIHPIEVGLVVFSVDITEHKEKELKFHNGLIEMNKIIESPLGETIKIAALKKQLSSLQEITSN